MSRRKIPIDYLVISWKCDKVFYRSTHGFIDHISFLEYSPKYVVNKLSELREIFNN